MAGILLILLILLLAFWFGIAFNPLFFLLVLLIAVVIFANL